MIYNTLRSYYLLSTCIASSNVVKVAAAAGIVRTIAGAKPLLMINYEVYHTLYIWGVLRTLNRPAYPSVLIIF
jgi:hypothetical protein